MGNEKHPGCLLLYIVNCHSPLLFIQLIQIGVARQGKFKQKINIVIQQSVKDDCEQII